MDFDAKYMENFSSQIPLIIHENYSSKPRDDQLSLDGVFSPKGTNNFLQDFHPLDNYHVHGPSSLSNIPIFSLQPTCLYPFDTSSSSCLPNFDFYETKPFGNHVGNNGALFPLMDNFTQSGVVGGGLGHSQMMATPISMISPSAQSHHPFSYRDFSIAKFSRASDEGSSSSPMPDFSMAPKSFSAALLKKGGRGRSKKKPPSVIKGQWTIEEDRLLIQLVERYGTRKWSQIAQLLNGRIGKQCRERWHNHLRPEIKKDIWSEEEDIILVRAHAEIGNKWAEIAKKLPGRTENSIKNHWNATKRRQLSRRKCRSKYPRQSTILQDYIKGLTPETIYAGCRKKPPSIKNNPSNNNNINNSPNDRFVSSESSSSYRFDFSEVPDFNFDDQMFEESSIDSLLDCVPNVELDLVEMINQVNL